MKIVLTVDSDEAEAFVVEHLKESYRLAAINNDKFIMESLDAIISYYSTPEKYLDWRAQVDA